MRYTIVVIVSCYIGLTYEFIAPKGAAENVIQAINVKTPYHTSKHENMDRTTILRKINTSLMTLLKVSNESDLDKALLAEPQEKKSEVNERAFVYIKSVKPNQNHLCNSYRNINRNRVLHRGEVFDDVARKFFDSYMKNGFFKVKGTEKTLRSNLNFASQPVQAQNPNFIKMEEEKDDNNQEKRDYLELLKVPLLRSLSKNNNLKSPKLNTQNLQYTTEMKKVDEMDFDEADTNKQVDNFIEQIISSSLDKQFFASKNKSINKNHFTDNDCDDCVNQIHIHTPCPCKSDAYVKQSYNFK